MKFISKIPSYITLLVIFFYQNVVSPFIPPSCRFIPSCSRYAIDAIKQHGMIKGLVLTIIRLSKCHPFSKQHGIDEAPKNFSFNSSARRIYLLLMILILAVILLMLLQAL